MADSLPYYTWEEVAQHTTVANGVWVVIDGCVYNVTKFLDDVGALYLEPPPWYLRPCFSPHSILAGKKYCWRMPVSSWVASSNS